MTTIHNYSLCLSGGIRKGLDCESYRKEIEAQTDTGLAISCIFYVFSFLSYRNLPFLVQFQTVKLFLLALLEDSVTIIRSSGSN